MCIILHRGGRNLAAKDNSTEQDKNQTRDKAERIEYARRIERVEAEKARERMSQGGKGGLECRMKSGEGKVDLTYLSTGQTRDIAAQKAGIGSGFQYEREKYIVDNHSSPFHKILGNGTGKYVVDKDIYRESTLTRFRNHPIIYSRI